MRIRVPWFVIAIVALACHSERAKSAAARVAWHVVDSTWVTPWDETTDSAAVYRVAITGPALADTLTDVLPPWPVIVGDSAVLGFRKMQGASDREMFRWSIPTKRMRTEPLPDDVLGDYNDVMISPGGQYVAYVAKQESSGAYGVVRDLRSHRLLWRGPTAAGCDCDIDLSHARWVSPDSFEIAVVSTSNDRGWAISSGSASAGRARLKYSATEPEWHAGQRP